MQRYVNITITITIKIKRENALVIYIYIYIYVLLLIQLLGKIYVLHENYSYVIVFELNSITIIKNN